MKLIPLIFSIFISVEVKCNERNNFPPKFHLPNSGMLTSDGSIYLPPETQSTMQYLPVKSDNNLQYPYLPITGTKAPLMFPTPIPMMYSTSRTVVDNDDDDEDFKANGKQPSQFIKNNRTSRSEFDKSQKNSYKPSPSYNQPIDRIDKKIPYGFVNSNPPVHPNPVVQKATPRSMVISEPQRNDMFDQYKGAAAYHGPSYLPAPGAPGVYISSTTETSVPIIRLSNEMDLDGSFSYEALGADQTHYVQHSRMENSGTDKEEQVVEGSYSYVGDNGQTYTVHYIADSKGFRASGDHLPVAPPVPEIIQRAVQFNLAEEAKKPPNLKSWHGDENEVSESEKYQSFIAPPSRPLFTGRAPQSFSFGFGQGAPNSPNNLMQAASTQNPININNGFPLDQMKSPNNGGQISPQVTFLATQGAHNPSLNNEPSIPRTTEKPTLPQLINYDAGAKESNEESNKALWRWQYGLNPNMNQTPEKKLISRSSGEGDNVIINFSDMTPEQYSKIIQTELEPKVQATTFDQVAESNLIKTYELPQDNNVNVQNKEKDQIHNQISNYDKIKTSLIVNNPYYSNDANNINESNLDRKSADIMANARSKLLTQNNFIPHSQTVTQSYDYEDISYDPRRVVKSSTSEPHIFSTPNYDTVNNKYDDKTQSTAWSKGFSNQIESIQKSSTTESPKTTTENKVSFTDVIVHEDQNVFKPSQPVYYTESQQEEHTTTTGATFENIISENVFLKSLFNSKNNDQHDSNRIKEESNKYHHQKINAEHNKPEKHPKFIQKPSKTFSDIKPIKKSMEMTDIMNYLSAKNNFESVKVKPKSKYTPTSMANNNYNQRSEVQYIPMQHEDLRVHYDNENDEEEDMEYHASNSRPNYYHPKQLQGIIKNYKVLQRNNSAFNDGHGVEQFRRNLSPPPVKMSNLPPLGRAGPSMKSYLPPIYV